MTVGVNDHNRRVGQWHPMAKLTDAQVDQLLALREAGWSLQALADLFEISKTQVFRIVTGAKRQLAVRFR